MKLIAGSILVGFSVLNLTLSSLQGTLGTSELLRRIKEIQGYDPIVLNLHFGFDASVIAIGLAWFFLIVGVGLMVWGLFELRGHTS